MARKALSFTGAVVVVIGLTAAGSPLAEASPAKARPLVLKVTSVRTSAPTGLPTPSAGDGIGPGSYLLTTMKDGTGLICTANFVWASGATRYLGAAGHCFLPSTADAQTSVNQYVNKVEVCVSSCLFGGQLGVVGNFVTLGNVVFARQSQGGVDVGNDFGLVEIPTGTPSVRSSVPVWGGPAGSAPVGLGTPVCLYGNGEGVGETFPTKARAGVGVLEDAGAWFADIPSAPGDSGSAVLNCPTSGANTALGILTHLTVDVGVVAGTTVARAVQMAGAAGVNITLVNG